MSGVGHEAVGTVFRCGGDFQEMTAMASTEAEAQEVWLQKNTFRCPHLHARITPQRCEELRRRPEDGSWTQFDTAKTKPSACARCKAWKEYQQVLVVAKGSQNEATRKNRQDGRGNVA